MRHRAADNWPNAQSSYSTLLAPGMLSAAILALQRADFAGSPGRRVSMFRCGVIWSLALHRVRFNRVDHMGSLCGDKGGRYRPPRPHLALIPAKALNGSSTDGPTDAGTTCANPRSDDGTAMKTRCPRVRSSRSIRGLGL